MDNNRSISFVLATRNSNKIREVEPLFSAFSLISMQSARIAGEAEETGSTFAENALIKARHAYAQSKIPAIADDSGIEVYALNGEPGIHSARYSGEHGNDKANNAKLLEAMDGIKDRRARFFCAAAAVLSDEEEIVCEGFVEGYVAYDEKGSEGFGYDSIFIALETGERYSEIAMDKKNKISHRYIAFSKLAKALGERLGC
ncbi:MAG: RdgB/HAM1 family non-canonical purine NTP pyrophosphatase [Eubacteriaceae bacterium]|jgi:XTP/dITP diphosphohydrolase|nr:RdgB/HAM1 family non-canonical purine NTP pyrophosphatase [Eubacteriaceae bacterium]